MNFDNNESKPVFSLHSQSCVFCTYTIQCRVVLTFLSVSFFYQKVACSSPWRLEWGRWKPSLVPLFTWTSYSTVKWVIYSFIPNVKTFYRALSSNSIKWALPVSIFYSVWVFRARFWGRLPVGVTASACVGISPCNNQLYVIVSWESEQESVFFLCQ